MNFLQITALSVTIFNVVLTLLVVGRDVRSRLKQVYLLWGTCIALWNVGSIFLNRTDALPPAEAFVWAKVLQLGVIFMPLSISHLCMLVAGVDVRRWTPWLYAAHSIIAVSLFFDKFVVGVRLLHFGYYAVPGPMFHVYSIFYVVETIALVSVLYIKQKTAAPLLRTRLRAMLVAIFMLWLCGTNDLMPLLHVDRYPFTNWHFYPLGHLAAMFYLTVVAYSVLQHQLLDIHVTLSRFAAQIVRMSFMFIVGLMMLLVIKEMYKDSFTAFSFFAALGVVFASALTASLFFPQFFGKGTDALERKILGDRFEYHARVQGLIDMMRSYPDPEVLLEEMNELLAKTMRVNSYELILLDETSRGFMLYHSFPSRPHVALPELKMDSALARYFLETRAPYLSCNATYSRNEGTDVERAARELLQPFEPEFCFPFFSADGLVGLMLLGPKSNHEVFTPYDLRLLSEFSTDLGLLLNQVRLRDQVQKSQEQELLGRMSRGLAHDLNNLLTPVHTFLQLFQEQEQASGPYGELAPVALRNLGTVRTYINEALFFSRTNKLNAKLTSLHETIKEAADLVQTRADLKNISIRFNSELDPVIEMDQTLIKRLICNLLSNAVDASQDRSNIEIALAALPKTEMSRDWYRVEVIDHGEGISPEDLHRIFAPYFTTKTTGDSARGFGLGLAICRKIATLHGGDLSVVSKLNKGTTMRLDLPSKLLVTETTTQPQPQSARQTLLFEHPANSAPDSGSPPGGPRDLPPAPAPARIAAA
ncbi:MAG: ATP-binding protein [Limisphaerales bacterium]